MAGWEDLLHDLEGQAQALDEAERDAETADRTRREIAGITLAARALAHVGEQVVVLMTGAVRASGRLVGVGPDWLLINVDEAGLGHEQVIAIGHIGWVEGLGVQATPAGGGRVLERLDLAWLLRRIARDRAAVRLRLSEGGELVGTIDRVGADHLDLAEHPPDVPRRHGAVVRVRSVPLTSVVSVLRL